MNSDRRACHLVALSGTVLRYESKARPDNDRLQAKLSSLHPVSKADLATGASSPAPSGATE